MTEETPSPFIELATRTLEDQPGIRDEARAEVMGRISHAGPPGGSALDQAIARLEEATPRRWGRKALGALVAFILLLGLGVLQVLLIFQEVPGIFGRRELASFYRDPAGMTTEQRALLDYFNSGPERNGEGFERLRELFPDNPSIFENYTYRHLDIHSSLPPGYDKTWRKIDPDNGSWLLIAAIKKGETALDVGTKAVTDEQLFQETLRSLEEAVASPVCEFRAQEFNRLHASLIKRPRTMMGEFSILSLSGTFQHNFYSSSHRLTSYLEVLFTIEAQRVEAAKDQDGLRRLISLWEKTMVAFARSSTTRSDLWTCERLRTLGDTILLTADRMGMKAEKERLEQQLKELDEASLHHGYVNNPIAGIRAESAFSDLTYPADYAPGRRTEYALMDQFLVLFATALLLLVLLAVVFESVRRGKRINGIADGVGPLFRGDDLLWIYGLGVLAPVAWYFIIVYLTPLGCRDRGLQAFNFPPSLIQALAGYLLLSVILVQTVQWRITRRARFMALGSGRLVIGWIIALIPAAVIPLTGAVRYWSHGTTDDYQQAMALACGLPLLWLLWQGGAMLFSPRDSSLGGVLTARLMTGPLVALIAFLVVAVSLLRFNESKWLERDTLTRFEPDLGGMTRIEAIGVQKRVETYVKVLSAP